MHSRDCWDYLTLVCTLASALAGVAGVVVVFWYTVIARRQAKLTEAALAETRRSNGTTEESNKIARQSLILARRAWLYPRIEESPLSKNGAQFTVDLVNCGGVPCTISRIDITGLASTSIPEKFEFSEEPIPSGDIVPPGPDLKTTLTMDLPTPLVEDSGALFVFCRFKYTDVFGEPREVTHCWAHFLRPNPWINLPQFSTMT